MRVLMLTSMLVAGLGFNTSLEAQTVDLDLTRSSAILCSSSSEAYDIELIPILRNRSAEFLMDGSVVSVKIVGMYVEVSSANRSSSADDSTNWLLPVQQQVDPTSSMDLILSLAVVDGRPGVYWRESYVNRVYRHGLMRLSEVFTLEPICQGTAGGYFVS